MTEILYTFTSDNGFAAVDLCDGVASYAYPTSHFAENAKRFPKTTATIMLRMDRAICAYPGAHERFAYIIMQHFPQVQSCKPICR